MQADELVRRQIRWVLGVHCRRIGNPGADAFGLQVLGEADQWVAREIDIGVGWVAVQIKSGGDGGLEAGRSSGALPCCIPGLLYLQICATKFFESYKD